MKKIEKGKYTQKDKKRENREKDKESKKIKNKK